MTMTRQRCTLAVLLCLSTLAPALIAQGNSKRPLDYVNTLVGTAPLDQPKLIGNAPPPGEQLYSGFTSPAATLPHSSTELGPINANLDVHYLAGVRATYFYPNRMIYGFSTGTGGSPVLMPVVGDFTVPPERSCSVYDKSREKASAGYYSAYLDDFHTQIEMTATTWTGIFRITFPASDQANILLDLRRNGGAVEVVGDRTLRGHTADGRSYFVAQFSSPFRTFGTFKQNPPHTPRDPLIGFDDVNPGDRSISGNYAGAYLRFSTTDKQQVLVKIASGTSYEAAEARLHAEQPGWDFDAIHRQAEGAWATKLNAIEVKGGTEKQRQLFYSCLYHSLYSPRLLARSGEEFKNAQNVAEKATYDRYGAVPLWDTGRNQIVLLTLLEPQTKTDILRSELDDARERGYMEPRSTATTLSSCISEIGSAALRSIGPAPTSICERMPWIPRDREGIWRSTCSRVGSRTSFPPAIRALPTPVVRQARPPHSNTVGTTMRLPCMRRNWARQTTTPCSCGARITTGTSSILPWGSSAVAHRTARGSLHLIRANRTTTS